MGQQASSGYALTLLAASSLRMPPALTARALPRACRTRKAMPAKVRWQRTFQRYGGYLAYISGSGEG
jgi:hypothetical protein